MLDSIATDLDLDRRPNLEAPHKIQLAGNVCHFVEVHPRTWKSLTTVRIAVTKINRAFCYLLHVQSWLEDRQPPSGAPVQARP